MKNKKVSVDVLIEELNQLDSLYKTREMFINKYYPGEWQSGLGDSVTMGIFKRAAILKLYAEHVLKIDIDNYRKTKKMVEKVLPDNGTQTAENG